MQGVETFVGVNSFIRTKMVLKSKPYVNSIYYLWYYVCMYVYEIHLTIRIAH